MTGVALWVLALFVLSIPSENGVAIAGVGSLSRVIGIVAFAAGALSLYERGRMRIRVPSLFLLVAACFVLWAMATFFWSVAPDRTIARASQFVQLLVFAWLIHQLVRSARDRDLLLQAFVLGCYVMIGIAMIAYFGSARLGYRDVVFSTNSFAAVAAIAIPMAWGLMLRRTYPWLQPLNLCYPLFALAATVLAASRGGLLTAIIALAVIPLTLPRLRTWARIALVVAVATVTWSAFTWLPQSFPDLERNLERLREVDEELLGGTMTGRTIIWGAGVEVLATSPIVGVGVGAFARASEPLLGRIRGAHNAFLSVAVTSGVVGLTLFVGMFVVVLVGLLQYPQYRTESLVLFVALVVTMIPSNYENNKFVWFILGLFSSARPVIMRLDAKRDRLPQGGLACMPLTGVPAGRESTLVRTMWDDVAGERQIGTRDP